MKRSAIQMLGYADPRGFEYAVVDIDLLVPDPENPRIPVQESTLDSLIALHEEDSDGLYSLAKDIIAMEGTSPSELLNVSRFGAQFLVEEGNRRIAARRILRNPEQLRGHVSKAELERWKRLAAQPEAKRLPHEMLVVISDKHDPWIDRRHLGPQGGVGVQQWNPEAKARREAEARGTKDRTLALIDALVASYPERFKDLRPPQGTFTTFERLVDSTPGRGHIGIDVDASGSVRLTKGERSLSLLEAALRDLTKAGKEKLTSRRIHSSDQITQYLDELDERIGADLDEVSLTLSGAGDQTPAKGTAKRGRRSGSGKKDVLREFTKPTAARPAKLYEELKKLRRMELPNAAIVMTRVFLEISADNYAADNGMAFAGDRNAAAEEEIRDFLKQLSVANIKPSKAIRAAIDHAASRPISLGKKLELVIRDLMSKKRLDGKEGNAKIREINAKGVVELLNDAVHRLENVPSIDRVDHVLEVMRPVHNAMLAS